MDIKVNHNGFENKDFHIIKKVQIRQKSQCPTFYPRTITICNVHKVTVSEHPNFKYCTLNVSRIDSQLDNPNTTSGGVKRISHFTTISSLKLSIYIT